MLAQSDYDSYPAIQDRRESPAEREIRQLRRRLDEMEAEKLGLTVEQLEEKRLDEHCEAIADRPEKETPAMVFIRRELEQRRQRDEAWLAAWGVPGDASDELKATTLNLRCDLSQRAIIGLVAACVGEELTDAEPTGRQMVRMFPALTPSVQAAIFKASAAFSQLRNELHRGV